MKAHKVHIILLAGGESRRMGCDKASLPVEGKTLLEERLQLLRSIEFGFEVGVKPSVWVSGSYNYEEAIPDKVKKRGPVGGIWSVVTELSTDEKLQSEDFVLVVPVDMPLLDGGLLLELCRKLESSAAVQYVNFELPLGFVYSAKVQNTLTELLKSQVGSTNCSVRGFLNRLAPALLQCTEPRKLANVNTPEEWERLRHESSTGR